MLHQIRVWFWGTDVFFSALTLQFIETVALFTQRLQIISAGWTSRHLCLFTQNQAAPALKAYLCVIHTAHWHCGSKRGVTVHVMMMTFVSRCFPDVYLFILTCTLICSHRCGSTLLVWYYLRRCIRGAAKFPLSPLLGLSHRGGCWKLVQDPCTQRAVWSRLLFLFPTLQHIKHKSWQSMIQLILQSEMGSKKYLYFLRLIFSMRPSAWIFLFFHFGAVSLWMIY